MIDVKALQVWDVRENEMAPWREAEVKNLRRDEVELQFLDMPNAPYATMIFNASLKRMWSDRKRYRLVRNQMSAFPCAGWPITERHGQATMPTVYPAETKFAHGGEEPWR
jgi:hypothetical protein